MLIDKIIKCKQIWHVFEFVKMNYVYKNKYVFNTFHNIDPLKMSNI